MAEEMFFVGIPNPNEIRRYLLESSKSMIQSLKKYEELKKIREEKVLQMNKFNQIMKQIDLLNKRLKKEFPKISVRLPSISLNEGEKVVVKKVKGGELDQLENELADIESKLNDMG
ncbi:MAG: hypothetical protein V1740_02760 [Candidatus Woesearchaeota archaeon]